MTAKTPHQEREKLVDDAMLGRLARALAHDFNGFLQIIRAHVDLLRATGVGPDQATILASIEAGCRMGADLAHEVLALQRRRNPRVEVVDLAWVVAKVAPLLRGACRGRAALALPACPEGIRVRQQPGDIARVLFNLVSNATQAVAEDGVVTVEVEPSERHVLLLVRDNGAGLSSVGDAPRGWGLGCGIVRDVVERLGGAVDVEVQAGRGTAVRVRLPRAAAS